MAKNRDNLNSKNENSLTGTGSVNEEQIYTEENIDNDLSNISQEEDSYCDSLSEMEEDNILYNENDGDFDSTVEGENDTDFEGNFAREQVFDKKSKGKNKGKIFIVGGVFLIVLVCICVTVMRKNNNTEPIEDVVEQTEETTTDIQTEVMPVEEIDYNKELANIVDQVVGKENCTTTDKNDLWKLYLLDFQLEQYAVYLDVSDKLNAVIIAKPAKNNETELDESISLVKSGFLGSLSDNNNVILTDSYVNQLGKYKVVVLGDNAKNLGEKAIELMKQRNIFND